MVTNAKYNLIEKTDHNFIEIQIQKQTTISLRIKNNAHRNQEKTDLSEKKYEYAK